MGKTQSTKVPAMLSPSPLRHARPAFCHLVVACSLVVSGSLLADENSEAAKWYREGRESLRADSAQDPRKGRDLISKAAEAGYAKAQCELGVMLMEGRGGFSIDRVVAFQWFERAATQGDAVAQVNLGWMKANGIGAPKNTLDAAQWYRRAAEAGSTEAQNRLGDLLTRGPDGLQRNFNEAAKWLKLAAGKGHAAAQNTLGVLHENGTGVPKDPAVAADWFRQAAEQGHARAQMNLGRLYDTGSGVPRDPVQACRWLVLSSKQEEINAKKYLESLVNQKRVSSNDLAEGHKLAAAFQPKNSEVNAPAEESKDRG